MSREWTAEQKMVLENRGNDLLVSAAAGSGKTAVMVERIIRLITEGSNPPDIDRFLVVTFTRAAANSMRERIAGALSDALEKDPGNVHLQRQSALLHQASITTIHSFCQEVVRSHFYELDIDPLFRIADEGEVSLLKEEVLDSLMELAHAKEAEDEMIRAFFARFAAGTSDRRAAAQVLRLYDYSCAWPWPGRFRGELADLYSAADMDGLEASPWIRDLKEETLRLVRADLQELERLEELCLLEGGPAGYAGAVGDDAERFRQVLERAERASRSGQVISYDELKEGIDRAVSWGPIGRCRAADTDPALQERVKTGRDELKKEWKRLSESVFACRGEQILEMNRRIITPLKGLIALTDLFEKMFSEAKSEKGIADFSDLEHFALQILTDPDGKTTRAGEEYAAKFLYVMTDEYQDSNLVQETILQAVSGNRCGSANRFMVGDVKQSIYRFRQARPDLFIEKYHSYRHISRPEEMQGVTGQSHVVQLHRNFRSRFRILESVNRVFEGIMGADVGDVDYDEDAMLRPGAVFPEPGEAHGGEDVFAPELLLLENADYAGDEPDDPGETEAAEGPRGGEDPESFRQFWERADGCEREACLVAQRIREMVGQFPVLDENGGSCRPCGYGDIAILYRGGARWAEALQSVCAGMGIPSVTEKGGGYFDTLEVRTVLSCLSIIDNPRQDIPLTGVLLSPIGGFTNEELALIRARCPQGDLYTALKADSGRDKTGQFLEKLENMRSLVPSVTVHELIWQILDRSGYEAYVSALPGGGRRVANLRLLVQKAMDFEKGSYRGLFNFLRYIRSIRRVSDAPEAVLTEEGQDAVRIMTIHKSKGLEFPVVFLCGLGKKLGGSESAEQVLLHPLYGAGLDYFDPKTRVRMPSLQRQFIADMQKKESMGEELRVLYVGMTRAKEKLVLTGTTASAEAACRKWEASAASGNTMLPMRSRLHAACYLDLIMPVVLRGGSGISFAVRRAEDLEEAFAGSLPEDTVRREETAPDGADPGSLELLKAYLGRLEAREEQIRKLNEKESIPMTVSVSELKHPQYEEEMRRQAEYLLMTDPPQAQEEKETGGAAATDRGTAYHTLMEHLDYGNPHTQEQLERLVNCGKIDQFAAKSIRIGDVDAFRADAVGERMKQAFLKGTLRREMPFVIGRRARSLKKEWDSDEIVLVQGIMDAWFEEDGELVLLDYKTDRVSPQLDPSGETLISRYSLQLELYREALEKMTGMKVKETLIYSFSLGKSISLPGPGRRDRQ